MKHKWYPPARVPKWAFFALLDDEKPVNFAFADYIAENVDGADPENMIVVAAARRVSYGPRIVGSRSVLRHVASFLRQVRTPGDEQERRALLRDVRRVLRK